MSDYAMAGGRGRLESVESRVVRLAGERWRLLVERHRRGEEIAAKLGEVTEELVGLRLVCQEFPVREKALWLTKAVAGAYVEAREFAAVVRGEAMREREAQERRRQWKEEAQREEEAERERDKYPPGTTVGDLMEHGMWPTGSENRTG